MNTFGQLAKAYVFGATPFAIAHLGILLVVCYRIVRMEVLRKQVISWYPDSQPRTKPRNEIVALLDEFVLSVKELGTRGEQVSASEHLQRIADATERRETHLNDAIHAFLLIGIAGTLFGLYTFAADASVLRGQDVATKMGPKLAESMARAFPVAFAGVVLMVFFQFISSRIESRFDFAIEKATQRVLAMRRKLTVAQSSLAHEVANSIKESMKPLQNLQLVLEQSLQPVILSFKEGLEQAISLVRTQFNEVNGYVSRLTHVEQAFTGAARQVENTTLALQKFGETISGRLDSVMQESKALVKLSTDLVRLSEFQQTKLAELSRSFEVDLQSAANLTDRVDDVRGLVEAAARTVSELPTNIQETLAAEIPTAIQVASQKLTKEWLLETRRLSREMISGSHNAITEMTARLNESASQLRSAVDAWKRLESNYESLIRATLRDAMNEGLKSNKSLLDDTQRVVATTVRQFGTAQQKLMAELELGVRAISKSILDVESDAFRISSAVGEKLTQSALAGLRPTQEAIDAVTASLQKQVAEILKQLAQRHPSLRIPSDS